MNEKRQRREKELIKLATEPERVPERLLLEDIKEKLYSRYKFQKPITEEKLADELLA